MVERYFGKMEAFKRLEESRKKSVEALDYEKEREEAIIEKYGKIERNAISKEGEP